MALVSLGTRTLDWDTRTTEEFDTIDLNDNRGYLFFVRTVPSTVMTQNQYLVMIAKLSSDEGFIETPLEAKFFPKGLMMQFSVAVPRLSIYNDPDVSILALPREFKRGTGSDRQLDIEVLYEDDDDLRATEVNI